MEIVLEWGTLDFIIICFLFVAAAIGIHSILKVLIKLIRLRFGK